jgi:hypothetical protein
MGGIIPASFDELREDELPAGVCFGDHNGVVPLRKLRELAFAHTI